MAISTGTLPKLLWPGLKATWGQSYDEHSLEYPRLVDVQNSEKNFEEVLQITDFGLAPVKPEGSPVAYSTENQGWVSRFVHVAYALGFIVTLEEEEDNLYEVVATRRTKSLAFSMRQTKENVFANMYNRFVNGSYTGGDGVSLGSVSHPTKDGNQQNILTSAADISEASLEDLNVLIMQAENDRGMKISLIPESLHVHPSDWYEANRILKSIFQADSSDNNINVLRITGAYPKGIFVNHYFTDPDAYFIRTNCPESLIGFNRTPIMYAEDNDFDTSNHKYKAYERYSVGWADWRGLYGSQGVSP